MLIYLGLSAVAAFVAALVLLLFGGASLPAAAHLVFAFGMLPLIFAAITHFIPVLTRSGRSNRGVLLAPLLLQGAGAVVFFYFRGEASSSAMLAAAGAALLIALAFAGWLALRARRTIGTAHPGWRWYLAAIVCLSLALLLVPAMRWWPGLAGQWRLVHLHLNLLGFIGLSALGTLQVLMPTVLRKPDADAALRLRRQLPLAASAVLAVAIGAAFGLTLALTGAVLLFWVAFELAAQWLLRHGWQTMLGACAALPLLAALAGFLLLIVLGILHALGLLDGQDAVGAFVIAFLLPLMSGALAQLLPVWYLPGKLSPQRAAMAATLGDGGAGRSLLFVGGGLLCGLGSRVGIWLAAAALLSFVLALVRALFAAAHDRPVA